MENTRIVGLTGGIGSGKSSIAALFQELGVPVYSSDKRAKELMANDSNLIGQIKALLGEQAYHQGKLDRKYIASKVFADKKLLGKLDAIVHPAVFSDMLTFRERQQATYIINESAILFESGADRYCEKVITVITPLEVRIERVMERDQTTRDAILARINNQMTDKEREDRSNFTIHYSYMDKSRPQVQRIHEELLRDFSTK